MNPNGMTGEPNQQNPTSVFGFDSYPPLLGVNWNQTNPFAGGILPNIPQNYQHEMFNVNSGISYTPSFSNSLLPGQTTTVPFQNTNTLVSQFSFGAPRPTPEIVHFPFSNNDVGFQHRELGCKRKTDSPPLQPAKQLITEEKMAEHLSKLHISSETAMPKESDTNRMQRLYMCEEMRKLQAESILPQTLLSKIQRPCTALVLWRPPSRLTDSVTNNQVPENSNKDKSEEPENEKEMNEIGMNVMDLDAC